MSKKKKEKRKKTGKIDLSGEILAAFRSNPTQSYNYKQISKVLRIKQSSVQKLVDNLMADLAEKEKLIEVKRGKYKLNYVPEIITGTVDMTAKGSAFIVSRDRPEDVFVSGNHLKNALHGDVVEVELMPKSKGQRPEGRISRVVKRKRHIMAGVIEESKKFAFLIPDEMKVHVDIFIDKDKLNGAKNGQKVIVKITDWPEDAPNPFGEVIEVLGTPGEHEVEMHAIMAEYGLPVSFPGNVSKAAEEISDTISPQEIKQRKDFRQITTFTIDPDDAKDFDDALSFRELEKGLYEIGVHIADVTHYVKERTVLDKEAYERGTSVYLVDRVVPMLPEKLSNVICSLRPKEDKLCFSAVFKMDEQSDVKEAWFGKTVINSDRRFTYDEAQKVIETGKGDYANEVLKLNKLAQQLREMRFQKGAINFEKVEVKFRLDDKGNPLGVMIKESKEAHKLIEEFMLLANKKVAETAGKAKDGQSGRPFVYRVHDQPDPEKMKAFNEFISELGYKSINTQSNKTISKSFNNLFKEVHGKGEENIIEQLAIRTMSKAIYTTNNIGHYGLAFEHYTHFTSPIRRYPDMLVHRLLADYLKGTKETEVQPLEAQCNHCSEMEKTATDAERASIKYKQVEFMKDKIGMVFGGIISGISEWGMYVEIVENKCEGMVRLREIQGDYYYYDEKKHAVVGKRYGTQYRMGDNVKVRIRKADLLKKQLDFDLAD